MAAVREPERLTYEDYCTFPDDGMRRELIDGEVYVTPAPRTRHQDLVLRVAVVLETHVAAQGGGKVLCAPYDVVLSAHDVVQPDVLFVSDADADRVTPANLQGAPTLAIEVLSDGYRDRRVKHALYAQAGVKEYWIVDPESDWVEVYLLEGANFGSRQILEGGDVLKTPLLPGLEINLGELFRR